MAAGLAESRSTYFGLLFLAFATEIDGTVARWLEVETDFGRRFDSWADLAIQVGALIGFASLFPVVVGESLGYYAAGGLALTVPIAVGLMTRGEPLGFHSLLSRVSGAWAVVGATWFLAFGAVGPLRVAALVEVAVAVEYFAIAALMPAHRGTVLSLRHALALRRGLTAKPAPTYRT